MCPVMISDIKTTSCAWNWGCTRYTSVLSLGSHLGSPGNPHCRGVSRTDTGQLQVWYSIGQIWNSTPANFSLAYLCPHPYLGFCTSSMLHWTRKATARCSQPLAIVWWHAGGLSGCLDSIPWSCVQQLHFGGDIPPHSILSVSHMSVLPIWTWALRIFFCPPCRHRTWSRGWMTGDYRLPWNEGFPYPMFLSWGGHNSSQISGPQKEWLPRISYRLVLSCSRPWWESLPSGYHYYLLKGLNLRYMYCVQNHFLNKLKYINISCRKWCSYWYFFGGFKVRYIYRKLMAFFVEVVA